MQFQKVWLSRFFAKYQNGNFGPKQHFLFLVNCDKIIIFLNKGLCYLFTFITPPPFMPGLEKRSSINWFGHSCKGDIMNKSLSLLQKKIQAYNQSKMVNFQGGNTTDRKDYYVNLW